LAKAGSIEIVDINFVPNSGLKNIEMIDLESLKNEIILTKPNHFRHLDYAWASNFLDSSDFVGWHGYMQSIHRYFCGLNGKFLYSFTYEF